MNKKVVKEVLPEMGQKRPVACIVAGKLVERHPRSARIAKALKDAGFDVFIIGLSPDPGIRMNRHGVWYVLYPQYMLSQKYLRLVGLPFRVMVRILAWLILKLAK